MAEFEEFRSRAEGLLREVLERTWRSVVEGEGSREGDASFLKSEAKRAGARVEILEPVTVD